AGVPLVLDAGGLDLLTADTGRARVGGRILHDRVVLTPHAGELERLLRRFADDVTREQIEADPAHWARRGAALTGATVLLKGAVTLIAPIEPGPLYSQADGTPWLATAGSGDVLAGILGVTVAQAPLGASATPAAAMG